MAEWRLEAKTRHRRHIVPMLAADAIRSAGGWVGDVHSFGDLQLVIHFGLAAANRLALEAAFADAAILVFENMWDIPRDAGEITGSISIMLIEP